MKNRILFGVTAPESLALLGGIPGALSDSGWEVHVVSSEVVSAPNPGAPNVLLHSIQMRRAPSPVADIGALVKWLLLIVEIRPHIISVGTPKAALLGLLAAWLLRVPSRVYVLRGLRLETEKGLYRSLLRGIERATAACSTHIQAVSTSLAESYKDLKICAGSKIHVLGSGSSHGVDLSRFSGTDPSETEKLKKALGLGTNLPVIGFVGRFCPDKGAATITAVHRHLVSQGVSHQMLVIGRVEDTGQNFDYSGPTPSAIKFLGQRDDVEKYYPLLDLLLLPTYREGFPNVVLEAASCGVPTLAYSATGVRDSIVHGVTGILLPVGDEKAFALWVEHLLRKPKYRQQLGENAHSRVAKEFDHRLVIDFSRLFYADLVSDQNRFVPQAIN